MKKFLLAVITAIMCIGMAACAPANLEKAEKKMEDAGYKVEVTDDADAVKLLTAEGAVGMIVAMKGEFSLTTGIDGDMVTAVLFESASAAKDYYEKVSEEEKEEDQVIKQDGKWVYVGTEDAVEDFTK